MEHLIQLNDISSYARPVSRHLDEDTANVFIREAESIDIRPAIGDSLFRELITYPDKWQNKLLLEGGWYPATYTEDFQEGYDESKCNAYFKGIKSALAYYTIARLIKGNDSQVSRFGLVEKQSEYSGRPVSTDRNAQYRDVASIGDTFLAESLKYLEVYKSLYPTEKAGEERKVKNSRTTFKVIGE